MPRVNKLRNILYNLTHPNGVAILLKINAKSFLQNLEQKPKRKNMFC